MPKLPSDASRDKPRLGAIPATAIITQTVFDGIMMIIVRQEKREIPTGQCLAVFVATALHSTLPITEKESFNKVFAIGSKDSL